MKLNTDKIVSGYEYEYFCAKIGTETIWEKEGVKFVEINIDNKLKFDEHSMANLLQDRWKLRCRSSNTKINFIQKTKSFI